MGEKIKVVIGGINGKMGRASARAILSDSGLQLVGAFGKADAAYVGEDVRALSGLAVPAGNRSRQGASGGGPAPGSSAREGSDADILVSNGFLDILARVQPDVYLDFTRAESAFELSKLALGRGICPVIGTSGLGEKEIRELSELATNKKTGAMIVPNFSVGAVLMMEFARIAGAHFSNVEIIEMHHTRKVDAPSGTAMHTIGKLASAGAGYNASEVEERELLAGARGGKGDAGVRVHSLRLPGLISHQEVIFGSDGELLTVKHDSFNTDCFVKGILMSVKSVVGMDRLTVGLENLLDLNAGIA